MNDLILHHYAGSPFSEKVRLVFGMKQLPWRSVTVPNMLPKPDVVALTGGYRRTPFLQIGADVYCDTALMCRVIDRLHPEPPLYPVEATGAQHLIAQWADSTLFWTVIPYTMQPAGLAQLFKGAPPEAMQAFAADRAAMSSGMRRIHPTMAASQLASYLPQLDDMLSDGRSFLLGEKVSIADFSVYHCLWFIRRAPTLSGILDPFTRLAAWRERMKAFGQGRPEELSSSDALQVSAAAASHAPCTVQPGLGFEAGATVSVTPVDYALDPVEGTLVGLDHDEVVIERRDERAGTVRVHFPRIGFHIKNINS